MPNYLAHDLIRKKRDGLSLTEGELRWLVSRSVDGTIPDYQISALLMAIYFRGMTDDELHTWTDAMLHSGDVLDFSDIDRPKVDKHSTGGVGDKISMVLAPAAAACGLAVPMISGRGLGHTGGTLDKLESIPGFRTNLELNQFHRQVSDIGVAIVGQTDQLVPADRLFYSLRDVTATVESLPLIASSIMSKKLAEGIDGLVLDIKAGKGAHMASADQALGLARVMISIGKAAGIRISAAITRMDAPIGQAIGNALEIVEAIEVLQGRGPIKTRELTVCLGAEMLLLGGIAQTEAKARAAIEKALVDGSGLDLFRRMIERQGGDPSVCDDASKVLPQAPSKMTVFARRDGYVTAIDSRAVGSAAQLLGAGRQRYEDRINPAVGVIVEVSLGDLVCVGQPLAQLHHADHGLPTAASLVEDAFTIGNLPPPVLPLVIELLR